MKIYKWNEINDAPVPASYIAIPSCIVVEDYWTYLCLLTRPWLSFEKIIMIGYRNNFGTFTIIFPKIGKRSEAIIIPQEELDNTFFIASF